MPVNKSILDKNMSTTHSMVTATSVELTSSMFPMHAALSTTTSCR